MRGLTAAGLILGLALPASGRQVQFVGNPNTLDIATWNVEWFGSTGGGPSNEPVQFQNVLTVIESAGIDLWALQEVSSASTFDELLAALGAPWAGDLATVSGSQRVAFLYRTDVVQKRSVAHILTEFADAFAGRPPLRLEASVTLPDTSLVVSFVTVHMKAFDDLASYDKRVEASSRLKNRFDFSYRSDRLVLLGDLNDELAASITAGKSSPYANFVDDPEDYRFLTLPLEQANVCTFCGGSQTSTIDHILVSDELFTATDGGGTDRLSSVLTGIPGFLGTTSDHVPVYARIDPNAASTAVEVPHRAAPASVYPLPARNRVTLLLEDLPDRPLTLEVTDLLGRRVLRQTSGAGERRIVLDLSGLPTGLYALRWPGGARLVPLVR